MLNKVCRICRKKQNITSFYKHSETKDGRYSRCRTCHFKIMQFWRKRNTKKVNELNKRSRDKRQQWINSIKNSPCMDCGKQYPPYIMQFDHRDRSQKVCTIYAAQSIKRIKEEIKKCDLVCANCHCERTHKQRLRGDTWYGRRI